MNLDLTVFTLPDKIKDVAYVINLHDYSEVGTH